MQYLDLRIEPDGEEPDSALILVDGWIGAHHDRFLLDTGAGKTCLILNEYTSALASLESRSSSGVLGTSQEDLVIVPTLTLGPISRNNFTVTRTSPEAGGLRNLVGMDLLKDYRCEFSLGEGRLYLDREPDRAKYASTNALFLDKRAHPYLDVSLGGQTAKAVWDTGASLTVVDSGFIQRHPDQFLPTGTATGMDASGTTQETRMFMMQETRIGGMVFPACLIASVDFSPFNATLEVPMEMIVGYNIISKADWLFDFPRRQWALHPR
jgi:predicted aspartyl protease